MNRVGRLLLTATALMGTCAWMAPAYAQEVSEAEGNAALMQAQLEALQAQVDALKERLGKAEKSTNWKGAPQSSGSGFTFKVRGRLQYDAGYVSDPDNLIASTGSSNKDLGFQSYVRRARLGVEGDLPGDFKYKAEFDFANASVGYGDLIIEYAPKDSHWGVKIGNMETNYDLEQMTSSRFTTFVERAQQTEAFYTGRRLGISPYFKSGDFRIDVGFYNTAITSARNLDEWLIGARAFYNPVFGDNQYHFGVTYQHREFNSNSLGFRYRARPFTRSTDFRFVDTGNLAATSDNLVGFEAAGIWGPFHAVGEWQWQFVNAIQPSDVISAADTINGTRLNQDPTFNSGYVEVGYFFTGEKRGYKKADGTWDRTKVLNSVDKGGYGAFQANLRFDYLDLSDNTSTATSAQFVNGGRQYGYGVSFNWLPIDYVKFIADYRYVHIADYRRLATPNATTGSFIASPVATVAGTNSADSSVFSLRAQVDW